jgi:HD-GYP domain-containing protein (c-di-GMP phosphodiesterase class II)
MPYIPIHLNTLRPDQAVNFDVHLLLSAEREHYVHYIKSADPMDQSRIEKLRTKGVRKLYIAEADEDKYLAYLDEGLNELSGGSTSIDEKANLTKDALHTQAENAERALETEKGYTRMQNQLGKIVGFFTSDKGALKSILANSGIAADETEHAANVTSLALGIAALANVTNASDLLDLGVACLLHDLGTKKLGFKPSDSRDNLTGDALRRYITHPGEGVALLAGKPFITPRVLGLVSDHEELGEGRGYPEKKRIEKLSTISQILNLSNAFDKFCSNSKLRPKEAMDRFFEKHSENFVLEHLSILTTVVTSK